MRFKLKTIGDGYSNIKVKVDAHCKGLSASDHLSQVTVNPSVRSEASSVGFCGKWTRKQTSSCDSDSGEATNQCESTGNTFNLTNAYK